MIMATKKFNVLFVCLGNICRSPLAEAIFAKKIYDLNLLKHIRTDSCGTGNYHIGEQPDPRTIDVAGKHGIPINHQCRQLSESDGKEFDMIIGMDESNRNNIIWKLGESIKPKLWKMRAFDPQGGENVPDPYHGTEKDFESVYQILDRSIDQLIERIRKENNFIGPESEA